MKPHFDQAAPFGSSRAASERGAKLSNEYRPKLDGSCGCDPPLASEIAFELATSLNRTGEGSALVKSFSASNGAIIAAGTTTAFVAWPAASSNTEGLVLAISFQWEADDYQTSPVYLKDFNSRPGEASSSVIGSGVIGDTLLGGPYATPLGSLAQPFAFPNVFGIGLPGFGRGKGVCLALKNNEQQTAYHARGFICGVYWDASQGDAVRKRVKQCMQGARGTFGGY